MKQQAQKGQTAVVWRRFSRKRYSAFASLGREIRIGVLTVAVVGCAARAQADTVSSAPEVVAHESEDTTAGALDEVRVVGTMAPLPALEAARLVSVITRKDIEAAAVSTPQDLFKLSSSVDVRQRGGFGIQTDISVDGGTYEQVTILLNGVCINNPHTGHLTSDFPVTVDDIERIEILSGADSRVYGGQAFGGAINIVTRRDTTATLTLSGEGGSHGSAQGGGRATFKLGRVATRVSGSGGRSDGGTIGDAFRKGTLYYQGDYTSRDLDLTWQFGFSRKDYGANTFYSASSDDQWEQNERYLVSLQAETKGRVHFLPSVYWNRTYDNYQWHHHTPNNSHQADVYGARLGAYTNWRLGRTALSAELREEGIMSSSLGTPMDTAQWRWAHGAEKQYTRRADRASASFSLEHNLVLPHWTISAGLMANMTTSIDHRVRFYPGIDIAYRPTTAWRLYLSYNKGFRLPSFTDLYYSSPDITGNAGLRPEINRSLSLGVGYRKGWYSATLRGFYNRGRHLIDYVKTAPTDAAHADNFTLDALGLSAQMKADIKDWATLALGYTYLHQSRQGRYPIFTSLYADDYLRHKFTARLTHRIVSKLSATWSVRYQRRMGAYQVYDGLKPTAELRAYKPYATLAARLAWDDTHYQLYVQADNLTDTRYQDLGNIPQPGLWIMAGAKVKLHLGRK